MTKPCTDPTEAQSRPAERDIPAGFRLVRIGDPQELEAGAYWPRLQPHFLKPDFRRLRYRIQDVAGSRRTPGRAISLRGASGAGELDVAFVADRLAATLSIVEAGIHDYCLTVVQTGALQFTAEPGARRAPDIDNRVGLIYRGLPGTALAASGGHERLAIWIPATALNQRLAALLGGPVPKDLAFTPVFSWDAAPAQGLRRLVQFMVDELGSPTPFAASGPATRSFNDQFLYTLLRVVPHNYLERLARGGGAAAPGIVRRAEEYIRLHVEAPIALHEIANAAGCSVRSLQLGFQRFRDTTPLAAIRHARLEAARAAIHSGQSIGTVTNLALRFGFTNPGRFAHFYRAAFGESPLEALRRVPWQADPRR